VSEKSITLRQAVLVKRARANRRPPLISLESARAANLWCRAQEIGYDAQPRSPNRKFRNKCVVVYGDLVCLRSLPPVYS
jgi:hypothetical protein